MENQALQRASAAAEDEYNRAAKHLISTVEQHRQEQQARIKEQSLKIKMAKTKIKELKHQLGKLQLQYNEEVTL